MISTIRPLPIIGQKVLEEETAYRLSNTERIDDREETP